MVDKAKYPRKPEVKPTASTPKVDRSKGIASTRTNGLPRIKTKFRGSTDIVYQRFSVFIEGVEVPFTSFNVTSDGTMPTANLSVPQWVGLVDIARHYKPKVHIFYRDWFTNQDCVLFSGHIVGVSYYKTKNNNGASSISFSCVHRYKMMDDIVFHYTGYADGSVDPSTLGGAMTQGVADPLSFNSEETLLEAMEGITTIDWATEINRFNIIDQKAKGNKNPFTVLKSSVIPSRWGTHASRVIGFTGVIHNIWNLLNRKSESDPDKYQIMADLYKPLAEEGLDFFRRVSGHYSIEKLIQEDRQAPCPTGNVAGPKPIITPPCMKVLVKKAVQADLATRVVQNVGMYSNEHTTFMQLLYNFYASFDYQMLILTSPAMGAVDPKQGKDFTHTYPIDVVVKPQMPLYYSPACNVIYPSMITTINVQQDEFSAPTRINGVAISDVYNPTSGLNLQFRGPNSIREAYGEDVKQGAWRKDGADPQVFSKPLKEQLGVSTYRVGMYEQGTGVRPSSITLPYWLSLLGKSVESEANVVPSAEEEKTSGVDYELLRKAWEYRYYYQKTSDGQLVRTDKSMLNPYAKESGLQNFQQILVAMVDYKYALDHAATRGGMVETVFNPYIVPGYPMDVINALPNEPSYHATCLAVSHSVTASSCATSVTMGAAISYTEMANYHIPFVYPWLQTVLKLIKKEKDPSTPVRNPRDPYVYSNTILNNPEGLAAATDFYVTTLGCNAIGPEQIFDFGTGMPKAPDGSRVSDVKFGPGGTNANPITSTYGNLSLCYRQIESREDISTLYGLKFIARSGLNYNRIAARYRDALVQDPALLEAGASMFLDYAPKMIYRSYFVAESEGLRLSPGYAQYKFMSQPPQTQEQRTKEADAQKKEDAQFYQDTKAGADVVK